MDGEGGRVMGGIYIKDVEMPIQCVSCPFWWLVRNPNQSCVDICRVALKKIERLYCRRPEWCPLVEVPAHGRLIDGDELDIKRREEQAWHDYEQNPDNEYLEGVKDGLHEAAKQLSIAPTIIPAEEDDNG